MHNLALALALSPFLHLLSQVECSRAHGANFSCHWRLAAAARVAREAAAIAGVKRVEYPIWGWTLDAVALIEESTEHGWRLDVTAHLPAKRRAIAAHASQYGGLIGDDPRGFQLPTELLQAFDTPWETFLLP